MGAFSAFYMFYSTAPLTLTKAPLGPGVLVAALMFIVVAAQPLSLLIPAFERDRRIASLAASALMCAGSVLMPFLQHWPGIVLLGLGFGIFVVQSTAWVRDTTPDRVLGRGLGIYGFGTAVGGAVGAPLGLILAQTTTPVVVAAAGGACALLGIFPALTVRRHAGLTDQNDPGAQPGRAPAPGTVSEVRSASAVSADELHPMRPAADQSARSAGRVLGIAAVLIGHLCAVILYAAVLSNVWILDGGGALFSVVVAFIYQSVTAAGRLFAGPLADRWSLGRCGVIGGSSHFGV